MNTNKIIIAIIVILFNVAVTPSFGTTTDSLQADTNLESLFRMSDSLLLDKGDDFASFYSKWQLIDEKFGDASDQGLQSALMREANFLYTRVIDDKLFRASAKEYLATNEMDCTYRTLVAKGIIEGEAIEGNIKESIRHFETLKASCTDAIDEHLAYNMQYVLDADVSLDSLERLHISEDEYLWSKAQVIEQMLEFDWSYGMYYNDFELMYQVYQELLDYYPDSYFADEAEWKLNTACNAAEVYDDFVGSQDCIAYYKSFLQRYPRTNLQADVYYALVQHYRHLESREEDRAWNLLKAIEFANTLVDYYTDFAAEHRISELLVDMIQLLDNEMWELKVETDKTVYTVGEPIDLNVEIMRKETSTKTKTLNAHINHANFGIYVHKVGGSYSEDQQFFEPNTQVIDWTTEAVLLSAGDNYQETIDLSNCVKFNNNKNTGGFQLPVGTYEITIRSLDSFYSDLVFFETVKIEVK